MKTMQIDYHTDAQKLCPTRFVKHLGVYTRWREIPKTPQKIFDHYIL